MLITNEDNLDLMARYSDNYFDLAIVDPPYGIGIDKHMNSNKGINGYKVYRETDWDNSPPSEEYFNELFRVSKNQIIWGGNYFINHIKNPSKCWLVWNKIQRNFSMADAELAYTSFTNSVRCFDYARGSALSNNKKNGGRIHPTQKPVQLYEWILTKYAKKGDKIIDTHLGSGSIAIACYNLNFHLTACEIDTEYFQDALNRFELHKRQLKLFKLNYHEQKKYSMIT
jgi:site-specific DNA-methyltransferase (adenine-specific)